MMEKCPWHDVRREKQSVSQPAQDIPYCNAGERGAVRVIETICDGCSVPRLMVGACRFATPRTVFAIGAQAPVVYVNCGLMGTTIGSDLTDCGQCPDFQE